MSIHELPRSSIQGYYLTLGQLSTLNYLRVTEVRGAGGDKGEGGGGGKGKLTPPLATCELMARQPVTESLLGGFIKG